MALTKRTEVGSRNVLADGQIQVRTDTVIEEDGVEISRTYHRHVVAPGDDLTNEDPLVRRVASAEHTNAVVKAYQRALAALASP